MRIGITGSQSVGKTTLLNALRSEKEFQDYVVCDEVTRWVKKIGLPINEQGNDHTQELIMMKHVYNIFLNKNMITDRTVLDGLVYTKWLRQSGNIKEETMEIAYNVFHKLISYYDYLFFIKPEFDIVSDGVRSTNTSFRNQINRSFIDVIEEHNIPVHYVSGSVRERVNQVLEVINGR
jgi:nicotinamide riboside kinase